MEKKLAQLYNELGTTIVSAIPVRWEKVYYLGEVEEKGSGWSSVFYFKEENNSTYIQSHTIPTRYNVSEKIYNQLLEKINNLLLMIYDCFNEEKQVPWEQLSLSIDRDGNFDIDYKYGAISDNERGPMEREVIWAHEAFGYIPEEGSYKSSLLNKYLEKNRR